MRCHRFIWTLVLGALNGMVQAQVSCNYTISPMLDFGTIIGLPTPQIDVTATVSATCSTTLLSVNYRACLSIPAGTSGTSIADRRMAAGGHFVQYQLYTNAARTTVWGAMGGSSPPLAVDFPLLALGIPRTEVRTIYGRVFAGQANKSVGTYQSSLTPIVGRGQQYALSAPDCQTVTGNATTLPTLPVQLNIQPNCTIVANPLDFGTVTGLTGHTASSNLVVTCTLNGAWSIALDGGLVSGDINARRMRLGPGPATIDYQLYRDTSLSAVWGNTTGTTVTGTGTGATQSVPIYGHVPPQGPKPPGTYSDTITATITF